MTLLLRRDFLAGGKADHAASLSIKGVRELIAKTRPLIAEMGDPILTIPVGGKGLIN